MEQLKGKYIEISGEIAGRIELENEKELLVRRAINYPWDKRCGLAPQAVFIDKKIIDNYWVRVVELPYLPDIINREVDTSLIRKYLNMKIN
ncbi:hypothetical protein MKL26_04585 [Streptococcus suis]|nr:hypothetical protein [Streptococcus suis]